MAVAIVTIICIVLIVVGGMTLSQGILTSTDSTAISIEAISVREGEMMRTELDTLRAAQLSWGDYLRVTVQNSGQIKLASFDKWDVIVSYEADGGTTYSTWLPYTTDSEPGNNEWTKARIGYNGPIEYFEPEILDPGEEMVILADINPLPASDTSGEVSLTTPNGIYDFMTFVNPGYLRLTPQSEDITLSGTEYYELVEAATADGTAIIAGTQFTSAESGTKLLYNTSDSTRAAQFIYPLIGIESIPVKEWTINYHCLIYGGGNDWPKNDNEISYNINVMVRQADGTLRTTIATGVAIAYIAKADKGSWVTVSGTYNFLGYIVVDQNDYLEIDFYGATSKKPGGSTGYMQLSIDDDSLPLADQTRITTS
jgi:hypothetical protein